MPGPDIHDECGSVRMGARRILGNFRIDFPEDEIRRRRLLKAGCVDEVSRGGVKAAGMSWHATACGAEAY